MLVDGDAVDFAAVGVEGSEGQAGAGGLEEDEGVVGGEGGGVEGGEVVASVVREVLEVVLDGGFVEGGAAAAGDNVEDAVGGGVA